SSPKAPSRGRSPSSTTTPGSSALPWPSSPIWWDDGSPRGRRSSRSSPRDRPATEPRRRPPGPPRRPPAARIRVVMASRCADRSLLPLTRARVEPLFLTLLLVLVARVCLARGIGLVQEPHRLDAHEERLWFEWAHPRSDTAALFARAA